MNQACETLSAFMAANYSQFRPYAYFDKHMDCIRVKLVDCSVTENRLNRIFTMLTPNDPAMGDKSVGVTIKGVAHLFDQIGLPMSGVVTLAQILDAIVKFFPDFAASRVREELLAQVKGMVVVFSEEASPAHA